MSAFKNVVVYGAGGDNIGRFILDALLQDGSYQVSVLSRKSSKSRFPASVRDLRVTDELPHDELVELLKDQDVVVSAVGSTDPVLYTQYKVIDAAIAAGVKRFVPSEYGFDNANPQCIWLSPIFKTKNEVAQYLDSKAREHPGFSWTALATGMWLEWALEHKFLGIDPEKHTVSYWDNGTHRPSHVTLAYGAQGLLEILKHPSETSNKRVFLEPFAASQREIVAELEKQQGVKYQETDPIVGSSFIADAHNKWEASDHTDIGAAISTTVASVLVAGYGTDFKAAGKGPLVETFAEMPKLTLQDVVKHVVSKLA